MVFLLLLSIVMNGVFISVKCTEMECYEDDAYVNDWDGYHDNIQTSYFLNGQYSYHKNKHEDRRFRWTYCRPKKTGHVGPPFTNPISLPRTWVDNEWERSCKIYNDGHSALIGGKSTHSNHYEDREWTFQCGNLDTTKLSLINCFWSGYVNSYDEVVDYDCPYKGLMRSIQSVHDNGKEDRKWSFECCEVGEYSFSEPSGYWVSVASCLGCGEFNYKVTEGITTTQTTTYSTSFMKELSATVSAGFEFKGFSASVSVTGTRSKTTVNTVSNSFTRSTTIERTFPCDKNYFFQWRHSVTVNVPEITSNSMNIDSFQNLCTDTADPKCPAGWCVDSVCLECKPGYKASAKKSDMNDMMEDSNKNDYKIYGYLLYLIGVMVVILTIVYLVIKQCNKDLGPEFSIKV